MAFFRDGAGTAGAEAVFVARLAGGLRGPDAFGIAGSLALGLASGQVARDFRLRASGENAIGVRFHVPSRHGIRVALLEQQPFVALAASFHEHQREIAVQFLAVELKLQVAAHDLVEPARIADE